MNGKAESVRRRRVVESSENAKSTKNKSVTNLTVKTESKAKSKVVNTAAAAKRGQSNDRSRLPANEAKRVQTNDAKRQTTNASGTTTRKAPLPQSSLRPQKNSTKITSTKQNKTSPASAKQEIKSAEERTNHSSKKRGSISSSEATSLIVKNRSPSRDPITESQIERPISSMVQNNHVNEFNEHLSPLADDGNKKANDNFLKTLQEDVKKDADLDLNHESLSNTPQNEEKEAEKPSLRRPPTARPLTARLPTARPTTARAAPPRIVLKRDVDELQASQENEEERNRLLSAKPVENLITESDKDAENDDDIYVVQEAKATDENEDLMQEKLNVYESGDNQKGLLVKQLIETKKELEGDKDSGVYTNDEHFVGKLVNRDIEKLKESIQTLTRLANPLGRVLDYLQEDIDTMVGELHSWEEEYNSNMLKLEQERDTNDNDVIAFRSQLDSIDREISEQMEKISITKLNIMKNEEKLQRMIEMVVEKTS